MKKSEKVPILGIFSPKTILMFRVGLKKLGEVGNRNHTYISFKPYTLLAKVLNYKIASQLTENQKAMHRSRETKQCAHNFFLKKIPVF